MQEELSNSNDKTKNLLSEFNKDWDRSWEKFEKDLHDKKKIFVLCKDCSKTTCPIKDIGIDFNRGCHQKDE